VEKKDLKKHGKEIPQPTGGTRPSFINTRKKDLGFKEKRIGDEEKIEKKGEMRRQKKLEKTCAPCKKRQKTKSVEKTTQKETRP